MKGLCLVMTNMKDVAQEAGVSLGSVSNYLNEKKIRPDAEERIKNAIKKLHYVRNNAARDLRTNGSSYVVFVLPTVWTPYFSELTFWIQKELDNYGYKAILCLSENQYDQEKGFVDMAEEQRVAGIISVSYSNLTSHVHSDIPLVSIEKEDTGLFPLVSSDNYSGGEIAAAELKKRQADEYLFIGADHVSSTAMTARKSGFVDYCNRNGMKYTLDNVPSTHHQEKFEIQINKIVDRIVANKGKYSNLGIFSYTDEVALSLYKELLKRDIRIPEDVQIVGFDGWKLSQDEKLSISSIRQPVKEIAINAVKQLDMRVNGESGQDVPRIMLPVTFLQGDTTKLI